MKLNIQAMKLNRNPSEKSTRDDSVTVSAQPIQNGGKPLLTLGQPNIILVHKMTHGKEGKDYSQKTLLQC